MSQPRGAAARHLEQTTLAVARPNFNLLGRGFSVHDLLRYGLTFQVGDYFGGGEFPGWRDWVVPGEPIRLHWQMDIKSNGPNVGRLSATVYLTDAKPEIIYQSTTPVTPQNAPGGGKTTGDQVVVIDPADPPFGGGSVFSANPLASNLWRLGSHDLRLEVTGDGPDAGPYSNDATLYVFAEYIGPNWWTWTSQTPDAANWKSTYDVHGQLTNYSLYANFTTDVDLFEADVYPGHRGPYVAQNRPRNRTIPKRASGQATANVADIDFGGVTQDWSWFDWQVWIPHDTSRDLVYYVAGTMFDQFANKYDVQFSKHIKVSVETSKQVWLGIAQFQQQAAYSAGVASLCWPPAAAVAAAAQGQAYAFGGLANDPPAPNRRYGRAVTVPKLTRPKTTDVFAQPFLFHYAYQAHVVDIVNALTETEARLLGARRDANRAGIRRQTNSYGELLQVLRTVIPELRHSALDAYISLQGDNLDNATRLQALIGDVGPRLTPTQRRKLLASDLSNEFVDGLSAFLAHSTASERNALGELGLGAIATTQLIETAIAHVGRRGEVVLDPDRRPPGTTKRRPRADR
jgi:hypothetical protein